jgi:hypothetical protein
MHTGASNLVFHYLRVPIDIQMSEKIISLERYEEMFESVSIILSSPTGI